MILLLQKNHIQLLNESCNQLKMGIKCVKAEQPIPYEEPIFLYHNMIKMKKNYQPNKQYQFLEKIGRGSFSEVYKVKSIKTGNLRAMKKIERRKNNRLEKMIMNQFNILREMDHPSIMKMYEYFQDDDFIYIAAQLCPGKELFDVIVENKCIPEVDARKIFYDIVGAVRYMHQNKIMHRDLKPENIMYDPKSGTVKIVDLGSAIEFNSSECCDRKRVGTSYYIAPQVLNRFYNEKCDVWSLGVILYVMLSGEPPFKGSEDAQILDRVKNGCLQFKKSIWCMINNSAKELIVNMIERNVKKRKGLDQIIKDNWFSTILEDKRRMSLSQVDQKSVTNCLSNIKSFKDLKSQSLQDGIITFIVNFVRNNEEANEMQKTFKTLDLNGDGVLSQEELCEGIMRYLNLNKRESSTISEAVFKKIDSNHSGYIDYSQFVIAASNFQITVSEQNLDIAFDYLDSDKSGKISAKQLKAQLGQNIPEQVYHGLMKKFDNNSDGEVLVVQCQISRQQFRKMMKNLINLKK